MYEDISFLTTLIIWSQKITKEKEEELHAPTEEEEEEEEIQLFT